MYCILLYSYLQVTKLTVFLEPLADSSIGCASKTMNSRRQMALLEQTKTVAECSLQLVHAVKEGGGNPKVMLVFVNVRRVYQV